MELKPRAKRCLLAAVTAIAVVLPGSFGAPELPHLRIDTYGDVMASEIASASSAPFRHTTTENAYIVARVSGIDGRAKNDIFVDPEIPMSKGLWSYLRRGLNFLESSGEDYPPQFIHPGGVAYGSLALTRIAIKDVIIHYKAFSGYSVDDILKSAELYEKCAVYFADLLLRHYFKMEYWKADKKELFAVLQRAWYLGPTLYKKGLTVPESREKNSLYFLKQVSA